MNDYPNGFDTPAFPDARRIAFMRWLAIWSSMIFIVVIGLAGLVLWSARSVKLNPFLLSTADDMARWTVVTDKMAEPAPQNVYTLMQESVVGNFANSWFAVSADAAGNADRWAACGANDCSRMASKRLCCLASDSVLRNFDNDVLPLYRRLEAAGVSVRLRNVAISNVAGNENGGVWRIDGALRFDNGAAPQKFVAFATVANTSGASTQNFGYYISDFSSYITGGN